VRYRQILVCEADGRLAAALQASALSQGWRLREVRHPRVCLGLLPQHGQSVFVLRLGRDLQRELTLLEQVSWLFPETATVVVCEADNPALVQLVWDLGAQFVLHPPPVREMLADVVAGFLPSEAAQPAGEA
jgi:hypothetical protein